MIRAALAEQMQADARDVAEYWHDTPEVRKLLSTHVGLDEVFEFLRGLGGLDNVEQAIIDELESIECALDNARHDAISAAAYEVDPDGVNNAQADFDDRAPSVETVLKQARNANRADFTVVSDPLLGRLK